MYTPHFQGTEGDTYTAEQAGPHSVALYIDACLAALLSLQSLQVIQALEPGLLPDRALKLQQVCHGRTFSVLPVLEGAPWCCPAPALQVCSALP